MKREPRIPPGHWTPETVRAFNGIPPDVLAAIIRGESGGIYRYPGDATAIEAEYRDVTPTDAPALGTGNERADGSRD